MWIIEIGFLDWTSMFLYLAFLLPFEATEVRGPQPKTLIYDGDCSLCRWISTSVGWVFW